MWLFHHKKLVFLLVVVVVVAVAQEQSTTTCETEDSDGTTCDNPAAPLTTMVCGADSELCQPKPSSLYSHGGSAQAYVPNAPVKSNVCENNGKHKVATWPFSRKTLSTAPKLLIRANLWSCFSKQDECCCDDLMESSAKAEVWQARPDGTYSSLQNGNGDCRATIFPDNRGQVEFTTLAPGSSGALGGLGPGGWDVSPWGPPVIHMLLTADNHAPLLIHVQILPTAKTLEERGFWGGDMRGHAGRKKASADAYKVTSWTVAGEEEIHVELDVFLTKGDSSEDISKELCPSFLYGMPSSFMVEPIAVCAPSLLNFFPL